MRVKHVVRPPPSQLFTGCPLHAGFWAQSAGWDQGVTVSCCPLWSPDLPWMAGSGGSTLRHAQGPHCPAGRLPMASVNRPWSQYRHSDRLGGARGGVTSSVSFCGRYCPLLFSFLVTHLFWRKHHSPALGLARLCGLGRFPQGHLPVASAP